MNIEVKVLSSALILYLITWRKGNKAVSRPFAHLLCKKCLVQFLLVIVVVKVVIKLNTVKTTVVIFFA